jgi:hypothetical protein
MAFKHVPYQMWENVSRWFGLWHTGSLILLWSWRWRIGRWFPRMITQEQKMLRWGGLQWWSPCEKNGLVPGIWKSEWGCCIWNLKDSACSEPSQCSASGMGIWCGLGCVSLV